MVPFQLQQHHTVMHPSCWNLARDRVGVVGLLATVAGSTSAEREGWGLQVNSLGTPLWTLHTTAVNSSVVANAIALTDPASRTSSVVVDGWFNSASATFGDASHVVASTLNGPNSGAIRTWDAFVFKVSGHGTAQWVRKAGGSGDDNAHAVAISPTGQIVAVGRTSSPFMDCQELRVHRASELFESYADAEVRYHQQCSLREVVAGTRIVQAGNSETAECCRPHQRGVTQERVLSSRRTPWTR